MVIIDDDANCGNVTSATNGKLTAKYCGEASGNKCTAKPDGSACAKIEANCAAYTDTTLPLCYFSTEGYCTIDSTDTTKCAKVDA